MDTETEVEGSTSIPRARKVERIYASALLATAVAILTGLLGADALSAPLKVASFVFAAMIPLSAIYVSALFDDGELLLTSRIGQYLEISTVGLTVGIACCFFHFGVGQGLIALLFWAVGTWMACTPNGWPSQKRTEDVESERPPAEQPDDA